MVPDLSSAPMLAAFGGFWILIAFAIGSAISEWLKKKRRAGEADPPDAASRAGTQPPPHPAATSGWEEELRRLLGVETPPAKPPPPIPLRPAPHTVVREMKSPPPVIFRALPAASSPPSFAELEIEAAERSITGLRSSMLEESTRSQGRAGQLSENVAQRIKQVEETTERHLPAVVTALRKNVSDETAEAISLLRHPRIARRAIIATVILGPPKSLELE